MATLITKVIDATTNVFDMAGDGSPAAGSGVAAGIGSTYRDRVTGLVYNKTAAGATAWSVLGGGSVTLSEFTSTTPSAPASGGTLFSRKRAGRNILSMVGPIDLDSEMQQFLGTGASSFARPLAGSALLPTGWGFSNTAIGTATAAALATTNMRTAARRLNFASAAGAGSSCGWLSNSTAVLRGNAAKVGGFLYVTRFAFLTMPATVRFFAGVCSATAALSNADPSTQVNMLGFAFDVADANFQALSTNATPTATKANAGFSWNMSDVFEVRVYCLPNDTNVFMSIQNLNAGTLFEATVTLTLPANTTFLAPQLWLNNGSTASACAVDFVTAYLFSDF